jgi:DNA-binding Lrp family transcriptional regulator
MAVLDDNDKKVLDTLSKDSRMSMERVAEVVSLSSMSLRRRTKRPEAILNSVFLTM